MEIKRLRELSLEILKTINSINPSYMKSIYFQVNAKVRPSDIV